MLGTSSRHKVGVLTFHRCINYGSYWQARCLLEGLRMRGHDAEIVDHDSRRVNRAEWRCGLRPVLPAPVPKGDQILYAVKMLKFGGAIRSLRRSARFALEDPSSMDCYELVVVGSDEVWNLRHPWYGGCALFFGDGIRARRVASYAASFGNYEASEGLDPVWADRLARFDAISVRDDNSRDIVARALGREPELVLDPCLQFNPRSGGHGRLPRRPFVAVYGHNFSPWFARQVRCWAESRGLRLVSVGYRNAWSHGQWLTAGPQDFARCLENAVAVATNFYHGAIFALRNARPFVCETTPYRSIKTRSLMRAVGAEGHLVTGDTPAEVYEARLSQPPEPAIFRRIDCLRQTSASYLDRALA